MEARRIQIEDLIKKIYNIIMALCGVYAAIYVVLFALCEDGNAIIHGATVILYIAICTCLWAFTIRQFTIEITTFYHAIKEKEATWMKVAVVRFVVMMSLCLFFCWVNFKVYDKLFG